MGISATESSMVSTSNGLEFGTEPYVGTSHVLLSPSSPYGLSEIKSDLSTCAEAVTKWTARQDLINRRIQTRPGINSGGSVIFRGGDPIWNDLVVPSPSRTNAPQRPPGSVVGMKKWVGQILAIEDGILSAELYPSDHEGPSLVADFSLRLLGPDASIAAPGAVVYLTTRLLEDGNGYIEAMTNLRMRRPRRWSKAELQEIQRNARKRAAKYASRTARRG